MDQEFKVLLFLISYDRCLFKQGVENVWTTISSFEGLEKKIEI